MNCVISLYDEDYFWTNLLPKSWNVIIYNKSARDIPNSIKLPNTGRESGTMLNYIINNYNKINNDTIFLQGNPFYHIPFLFEEIKNDFSNCISTKEGLKFITRGNIQYHHLMEHCAQIKHSNQPIRGNSIKYPNFLNDWKVDFSKGEYKQHISKILTSTSRTCVGGLTVDYGLKNLNLPLFDGQISYSNGAQYLVPAFLIKNKSLIWWEKVYDFHENHLDKGAPWLFEFLWHSLFIYPNKPTI